ncbi:MAG TPA: glutaredoxin family protein [Chloroflexota bacterium]
MRLTLYSKPGCHLCEQAKDKIARLAARGHDLHVDERDITTDPTLFARYRYAIPVIELPDGRTLEAPISEYKLELLLNIPSPAIPSPAAAGEG